MKPSLNKIVLYTAAVIGLLFVGSKLPEIFTNIFLKDLSRVSSNQYKQSTATSVPLRMLPLDMQITNTSGITVVSSEQIAYDQLLNQPPLPDKIERIEAINDTPYSSFPKTIADKVPYKTISFVDTGNCYDLMHTLTYPVFQSQATLNNLIEKESSLLRDKCAAPAIPEINMSSTTCNRVTQLIASCNFNSYASVLFASDRVVTMSINNTLTTHPKWNLYKSEFINKILTYDIQQNKEVAFKDIFKIKSLDEIKVKVLEEIHLRQISYTNISAKEKAKNKIQESLSFEVGISKSGVIFIFNNEGVVDPATDVYNPYLEQINIPFTKLEEYLTTYGRSFFPLSD